ncbi:MAG: cysteine synthase family protein [SAR202 cluster bacterium]|nr:cysteine synthase family protein [SAR202 cluster bacterium]
MKISNTSLIGIGNTPLVKLNNIVPKHSAEVWVKLEGVNPTGSYKDRMAVSVLSKAMERGDIKRGDNIVEYTGGSTGTSLAFVSAVLGLTFTAVFSDAFSKSKQQSMEAFGAKVIVEKSENGSITPDLIKRMRDKAYKLARTPGTYYVDQFASPDVRAGFKPLGIEIAKEIDGPIDVFCAAVGTGGALMGTYDGLIDSNLHPDLIALEPLQSPLLTTGTGGPHKVEGIGVGFEPPFLDKNKLKAIRAVDQEDAFKMCRLLAEKEGIWGGGSTGLNVVAAIKIAEEIGPGKRVLTLNCDNGIKYLGSHIYA